MPAETSLRRDMIRGLDSVEGWLQNAEAWGLLESARTACPGDDQALAVEIGSYKGRSAIALATGMRARGGGTVIAIDPFDHEPGQEEAFRANVDRAGLGDIIRADVAFSHDARPRVADRSVSVLFVDGSHEYEDVLLDIRDWESAMKDGGVVAFNDPFWTGVSRALRDAVAFRGSAFRNPRLVVNTLFFDYRPSAPWTWRDELDRLRLRGFLKVGRIWYRAHLRLIDTRIPGWVSRALLQAMRPLVRLLVRFDRRWDRAPS